MTLPYTIDGTTYSFTASKGYHNSSYFALWGTDSTMGLPAIAGKKLVGVTVRISDNSKGRTIKVVDASGNTVSGCRELSLYGEESFHWDLKGTLAGTSYRLYSASGLPVGGLRLTYE